MAFGKAAGFGSSLSTPSGAGPFGSKRNLLKQMVRNVKPTKLSTKKASMKGVLAKSAGQNLAPTPAITGGSPFSLKGGMGPADSTQMAGAIHGGGGANLGASGVF